MKNYKFSDEATLAIKGLIIVVIFGWLFYCTGLKNILLNLLF